MRRGTKMNKKILLLGLVVLGVILCTSMVSAVVPNRAPCANCLAYGYAGYGSAPVNPMQYPGRQYADSTVRVGGPFGQGSWNLIGLRAGMYDGPLYNQYAAQQISGQYYRIGGRYFGNVPGYGYGYSNLRYPGTFTYGGTNYRYSNAPYQYRGLM